MDEPTGPFTAPKCSVIRRIRTRVRRYRPRPARWIRAVGRTGLSAGQI